MEDFSSEVQFTAEVCVSLPPRDKEVLGRNGAEISFRRTE